MTQGHFLPPPGPSAVVVLAEEANDSLLPLGSARRIQYALPDDRQPPGAPPRKRTALQKQAGHKERQQAVTPGARESSRENKAREYRQRGDHLGAVPQIVISVRELRRHIQRNRRVSQRVHIKRYAAPAGRPMCRTWRAIIRRSKTRTALSSAAAAGCSHYRCGRGGRWPQPGCAPVSSRAPAVARRAQAPRCRAGYGRPDSRPTGSPRVDRRRRNRAASPRRAADRRSSRARLTYSILPVSRSTIRPPTPAKPGLAIRKSMAAPRNPSCRMMSPSIKQTKSPVLCDRRAGRRYRRTVRPHSGASRS